MCRDYGQVPELYLSVSARKRPSCTIREGVPGSGSPRRGLCSAGVSCCLGSDSSVLLASSDFSGTASFSASANPRGVELRQDENAHLGPQHRQKTWDSGHRTGRVSLGDVHLATSPSLAPSLGWASLTTPPTCPIGVRHAPKDHTLAPRTGGQVGSALPPTWGQPGQGGPHSAAQQRVQHEHPVWADLAPAEDMLHLEREGGCG